MTNSLIAVAINLVGMLLIYSLMANAIIRFYWHDRGAMAVLGTIIVAGIFWILFLLVPYLRNLDYAPNPLWFGNWLVSGFSVVILCQSGRWIPRELEDSARLDGCGWFYTYWHVVLPLVRRELAVIALLTVIATSPIFWPPLTTPWGYLPLWLFRMLSIANEDGVSPTAVLLLMIAASLIRALPVIVIFFLSKRWFRRPAKLE